jgi:hypothetical protein
MRRLAPIFALLLILAACGENSAGTTTSSANGDTTTAATDTTVGSATTTADSGGGDGVFVLTAVTFGEAGTVTITNIGSGPGSLAGHFLCQRPSYASVPDTMLAPGESITLTLGEDIDLGTLRPADGEVGLYSSSNFASADHILSYVEWGNAGHGRSSVAGEAGIWESFIETGEETTSITAISTPAMSPDDWDVG